MAGPSVLSSAASTVIRRPAWTAATAIGRSTRITLMARAAPSISACPAIVEQVQTPIAPGPIIVIDGPVSGSDVMRDRPMLAILLQRAAPPGSGAPWRVD